MTTPSDFSDLRAVFINCTLKRSPEVSNTQGLADRSIAIMEAHGVAVEQYRAIDYEIATGVWPDMTEHGWPSDEWPQLYPQVLDADILVLAGPIWTPAGSARQVPARPTSTRDPAAPRTTSPTGTPRS